jgi:hypothetical protein
MTGMLCHPRFLTAGHRPELSKVDRHGTVVDLSHKLVCLAKVSHWFQTLPPTVSGPARDHPNRWWRSPLPRLRDLRHDSRQRDVRPREPSRQHESRLLIRADDDSHWMGQDNSCPPHRSCPRLTELGLIRLRVSGCGPAGRAIGSIPRPITPSRQVVDGLAKWHLPIIAGAAAADLTFFLRRRLRA